MTTAEIMNHVTLFLIMIQPVAMVAGPQAIAIAVTLGSLWLCAAAPGLLWVAVPCAVLWTCRRVVRWFFEGLLIGAGARLTGVFNSSERAEAQRERFIRRRTRSKRWTKSVPRGSRAPKHYFPWLGEGPNDDIPFGG